MLWCFENHSPVAYNLLTYYWIIFKRGPKVGHSLKLYSQISKYGRYLCDPDMLNTTS